MRYELTDSEALDIRYSLSHSLFEYDISKEDFDFAVNDLIKTVERILYDRDKIEQEIELHEVKK